MKNQSSKGSCFLLRGNNKSKAAIAFLISFLLVFQNITSIFAGITGIFFSTNSDSASTTVTASVYANNSSELLNSTSVSYSVNKDGIPVTGIELPVLAGASVQPVSDGVYKRDYQFSVNKGMPYTYKQGTYSASVNAIVGDSFKSEKIKLFDNNESLEFVDISCSNNHSLALTNDGTVWAWGRGRV